MQVEEQVVLDLIQLLLVFQPQELLVLLEVQVEPLIHQHLLELREGVEVLQVVLLVQVVLVDQ
jgi:hypothetical protein